LLKLKKNKNWKNKEEERWIRHCHEGGWVNPKGQREKEKYWGVWHLGVAEPPPLAIGVVPKSYEGSSATHKSQTTLILLPFGPWGAAENIQIFETFEKQRWGYFHSTCSTFLFLFFFSFFFWCKIRWKWGWVFLFFLMWV